MADVKTTTMNLDQFIAAAIRERKIHGGAIQVRVATDDEESFDDVGMGVCADQWDNAKVKSLYIRGNQ